MYVCVCVYAHDPECESQESQTGFITLQTGPLWFRENHPNSINSCRSNAMSPLSFFHPLRSPHFSTSTASTHFFDAFLLLLPLSVHHNTHRRKEVPRVHTQARRTLFSSSSSFSFSGAPQQPSHCPFTLSALCSKENKPVEKNTKDRKTATGFWGIAESLSFSSSPFNLVNVSCSTHVFGPSTSVFKVLPGHRNFGNTSELEAGRGQYS